MRERETERETHRERERERERDAMSTGLYKYTFMCNVHLSYI